MSDHLTAWIFGMSYKSKLRWVVSLTNTKHTCPHFLIKEYYINLTKSQRKEKIDLQVTWTGLLDSDCSLSKLLRCLKMNVSNSILVYAIYLCIIQFKEGDIRPVHDGNDDSILIAKLRPGQVRHFHGFTFKITAI